MRSYPVAVARLKKAWRETSLNLKYVRSHHDSLLEALAENERQQAVGEAEIQSLVDGIVALGGGFDDDDLREVGILKPKPEPWSQIVKALTAHPRVGGEGETGEGSGAPPED